MKIGFLKTEMTNNLTLTNLKEKLNLYIFGLLGEQ